MKKTTAVLMPALCMFVIATCSVQHATAQKPTAGKSNYSKTITGKITDTKGEPIEGATVQVKGKNIATTTNADGLYNITITDSANVILTIGSLGYTSKDVRVVIANSVMNVRLEDDIKGLNDVVVIGYGSVRRKDLTGAVGTPNVADMQKAPVVSFSEALAGRVAGLQVSSTDGQPGNELQIVLRGNNSVTQSNLPLFVIDGFPVEAPATNIINPQEIESIDVLKDASATAIYGARGANGVIIITTKKGKIGAPEVTYNAWVGFQRYMKKQEMMNPYEFVKYQIEQNPTTYTPIYLSGGKTIDDYKNVAGIDWQDLIFRDAFMQNHTIALRGGNEKTRYSFSGSLLNQDGIIINSGFNRYQGRLVLDQTINTKFKAGVNINYTSTKTYGTIAAQSSNGPTANLMYSVWGYRPVTGDSAKDAAILEQPFDPDVDPLNEYRINPVISTSNEYNPLFNNTIFSNAYIEFKPSKYFTLRVTGGYTKTSLRKEIFNNSNTRLGNPKSSNLGINGSISSTENTSLLNENTLTYSRRFNSNHNLNVVAGYSIQQNNSMAYGFSASQIPNESLGISGLDEGIIATMPTSKSKNVLISYLGRINYAFKSKYMVTFSMRADGSSKFVKDNRWAYFPSGSLAWRIFDEPFMKKLTFLSDAKIRGGFGLTGNNGVGDFAYLTSLQIASTTGYSNGNSPVQGIVPNNLGNNKLKWETTAQTNIGIDLSFLKNRINLTVDYYKKITKDLLLNATLPTSTGYVSGYKNVGRVSNQGIEFTLNTTNIEKKNFTWTTSFNIAFNKNKVLELNNDEPSLASRITWGNFNNAFPYIAIPGHATALFYGFLFDGVYQYSDFNQLANGTYVLKDNVPDNGSPRANIQPGYIKYKDINGDRVVDNNDLTIIGNPNPIHIGGITNNFTYKNFDLSVFFQWSYGNDILNANRIEFEAGDVTRGYLNMFKSFAYRWTPENQTNDLYKVGGQGAQVYSSRTIEDGSYIRLKTISLGYNLPASVLKKAKIKAVRIYGAAQNLLTWTKYSGIDPEVSVKPSALTPNFDFSAYPRAKTITFGLNVTF